MFHLYVNRSDLQTRSELWIQNNTGQLIYFCLIYPFIAATYPVLFFLNIYISMVLFNDTDSGSDYVASNGRTINEQWIGKDMDGSGRGQI
jgi:hypothetical protein